MNHISYKRILYRATYRGGQEADIILKNFVNHVFNFLTPQEINDLDLLLEQDDNKIFEWIEDKETVPKNFDTSLLCQLRSFVKKLKN